YGGIETITLAVDEGILTATAGDSGVFILSGDGTGTLVLSGTIAQLNAFLGNGGSSTLVYFNGSDNPSPSTTLSLAIDDGGNTGAGGALTDIATATINIISVNDIPVVAADDVTGGVTELVTPVGDLTDTGTIAFTDVDLTDSHTISSITPSSGALGGLTANVTTQTDGAGLGGVITWDYSVAASAVEYLGAGETRVESFVITLDDGNGGTVDRTIEITITGTNDAPVVSGPVTLDAIAEDSGARIVTQAELLANASDVDGPNLTAIDLVISSGAGALTDNMDGTWTYVPAADDDTDVSFEYQVTDGIAAPVAATATMDITPVNDAPVATIALEHDTPPVPIGGEILVNTATEDYQSYQKITTLSNGGFVVTWQDYSEGVGGATGDASGSAIKAQVFGADGTAVGTEILVNTATESFQGEQEITALSNGGFVITWQDYSEGVGGAAGDASRSAVKAQVFDAVGDPVGDEILVNTAVDSYQLAPEITSLSNGGFVVTWEDQSQGIGGTSGDTSNRAIKAQVFTADGTPVGTEILVNTATASNQSSPDITSLSNGGFVITWEDSSQGSGGATGDTSGGAIKAQVFNADGTPVGTEFLVNTATQGNQFDPIITAFSNGGFVIAWETGDIKAQVFGADGTPLGSEILVNTKVDRGQRFPEITELSNGRFVVTWEDSNKGSFGKSVIRAQVFEEDGTPVGTEILVNTAVSGIQGAQEITALSNGGFVVTWGDGSEGNGGAPGDASDFAIKAQVFDADGTPVGTELLVNTATEYEQYDPSITALPNGGFVVTWNDNSQGVGGATGDTSGSAIKAQVYGYGALEQTDFVLKGIGM
ncbi:MAG: cadherin-like domain-containing protein, partial [Marinobacter alexandrii]|uniref:cadherin-like domain-containing protein n=1 Tax=Marinobacter alexandrii TaxID=2570351 RepID=UPI0032994D54